MQEVLAMNGLAKGLYLSPEYELFHLKGLFIDFRKSEEEAPI